MNIPGTLQVKTIWIGAWAPGRIGVPLNLVGCVACLSALLLAPAQLRAQSDLVQKSETIGALLQAGKFDEAEPLVRDCLRQVPEDIHFLARLDMVLNGQGKYHEADEVHDRIRNIWERDQKQKWTANGGLIADSYWTRVIAFSQEYYVLVLGAEYFITPREGEGATALVFYYRVTAFSKDSRKKSRIFELDKGIGEENYFLEEHDKARWTMVAIYRKTSPIFAR